MLSTPVKFADDLELDWRAYELRRSGQPIRLSRIPMELLFLLVERRGELVTRDEIVARIWGKDVFLDTDNSINAAVRKLRQVLDNDPEHPRYLQTVTRMGYRFIAPVLEVSPPDASPATVEEKAPEAGNLVGKKVSHYLFWRHVMSGTQVRGEGLESWIAEKLF
jgi:DNA-binding winged helix-turn-helix (wHTH) protein